MKQEPKKTKMIGNELKGFRNPNKKTKPLDSELSEISFVLATGEFQDFDLKHNIILGRELSLDDEIYKVDLSGILGIESGISREHLWIQKLDDKIYVCDLNSTNGTYLNGEELFPMRNYPLANNDLLLLGKISIEVRMKKST